MKQKKALITGITGQDGSYLAEHLLSLGYEVHGIVRRVALEDPTHHLWRLLPVVDRLHLHSGTLESFPALYKILRDVQPDECYHLAAQSFVSISFEDEFSTMQTNINGTHFLLAALKDSYPECRFYFAGSSEMFGKVEETPQSETTRFHPRSVYGITKVAGFELTRNYREAYGTMSLPEEDLSSSPVKFLPLQHALNSEWKKNCGLETLKRKEIGAFPESM